MKSNSMEIDVQDDKAAPLTTDPPLIHAKVARAFILPGYDHFNTRSGSPHSLRWNWVAGEEMVIPPGHRIIAEVSKDGIFTVRRGKL